MMKLVTAFLLLINCSFADFQSARVTLEGSSIAIDCQWESERNIYLCQNGSKNLIIRENFGSFIAIGNWESNNSINTSYVENIEVQDPATGSYETTYLADNRFTHGHYDPTLLPFQTLQSRYALITTMLSPKNAPNGAYSPYAANQSLQKSPEELAMEERIDAIILSESREIRLQLDDPSRSLILDDGTDYSCNQATPYLNLEFSEQCPIYNCGVGPNGGILTLIGNRGMQPWIFEITDSAILNTPGLRQLQNSSGDVLMKMRDITPTPVAQESSDVLSLLGFQSLPPPINTFIPSSLNEESDFFNLYSSGNLQYIEEHILNKCDQNSLKNFNRSKESFTQRLDTLELIQFIGSSDDIPFSQLTEVGSLDWHCTDSGVYFDSHETYLNNAENNSLIQNATSITLTKAQELFDQAKAMDDIAWDYTSDGCYARAHLMARRFEEQGIFVEKAWIKGDLEARDDQGNPVANWNFHVAPVVKVEQEDGRFERYIIDPSIETGPIPVSEWAGKLVETSGQQISETRFPFPENSSTFNRASLAFSDSDPYLPNSPFSLEENEAMIMSQETMQRYKAYMAPEEEITY